MSLSKIQKTMLEQSIQDQLNSVGTINSLQTTDKSNLVNAINENKLKISDTAPTDGSLLWVDTTVD